MSGKQNHGKSWDADSMIRNAKALQRVVKELEKNKPKPTPSDGWGKWDRGTEDQLLFMGRLLAVPKSIVTRDRDRAEGLAVSGTTKGP